MTKHLLLINRLVALATGCAIIAIFTGPTLAGVAVTAFGVAWLLRGKVDSLWFVVQLDILMKAIEELVNQKDADQKAIIAALDDMVAKFSEHTN